MAGIQVSVRARTTKLATTTAENLHLILTVLVFPLQFAANEFQKVPIDIANDEFWFRQKVASLEVYSTVTYFASPG